MPNLFEKLVGDLDHKRQYRDYRARMKALDEPYRAAGLALERYMLNLGVGNDSEQMLRMLDDLVTLLEQGQADGTPLRAVVGDDPVDFAEAHLANYPQQSWVQQERSRLASAIDDAIDAAGES